MADDIDDLLDECETKFCDTSKPNQKQPSKTNLKSSKKATRNEDRMKRFIFTVLSRCFPLTCLEGQPFKLLLPF